MRVLYLLLGLFSTLVAKDFAIKITKELPFVYADHFGQKIMIKRIQDPSNRLSDDYTKTSRECPPFCITPIKVAKGVKTVSEIEVLDVISKKSALVVDCRLREWYELESIPSAINIPFKVLEGDKKRAIEVLKLLGVKDKNGKLDFKEAEKLLVFCNGIWCFQSHRFIKSLLKFGYPADKILYYRDGMQGWKFLGLTTVVTKEKRR
jgi:rhodanese-related sulfurtransferase